MMVFDNCKIPVYDTTAKRAEFSPINANTVVIDNSIVDGKECVFRSSVMHECGHGMYHREIFEHGNTRIIELDDYPLGIAACRASDVVGGKKSLKMPRDWIEHHAKVFSAAILMPRYAMRIVCYDKSMRECAENFSPEYADEVLTKRVADVFEVSEQSAKIRIKQLNLNFSHTPKRQVIFV
jgi:Zn-dependent peptidase ImmA (M78 family)